MVEIIIGLAVATSRKKRQRKTNPSRKEEKMESRVWLKEEVSERFPELKTKETTGEVRDSRVYIEKLRKDLHYSSSEGGWYINHNPILDPSLTLPPELIEKVTLTQNIYSTRLYPEGVYYHEGGKLRLITSRRWIERESELYQKIEATAPNVDILEELVSLVLQRKLQPKEDWSRSSAKFATFTVFFGKIREKINSILKSLIMKKVSRIG